MDTDLFENQPIHKAYLKLAVPLMLSNVLMLVYNMADTYFIAKTGSTDLIAGVSVCSPVFHLLIAVGDIMGLGGSSFISRALGKNKGDDAKRISVFCFLGGLVLSVAIAALLLVFMRPLLYLLGANDLSFEFARAYYFWIAIGSPTIIFSLIPSNLLRTEGLSGAAMAGSVTGSVINLVLDPILIFSLNMGAGGAALATIIANLCADIVYLYFVIRKSHFLSLNPQGFFIRSAEVAEVLRIGVPASITNIMQSVGVMILNRFLEPYGNDRIAAMGIVLKVVMLVNMIMVAFSFGGQPLYGYLYGAKNFPRFRATVRFAYGIVCASAVSISLILFVFANGIMNIFVNDPLVIDAGIFMLRTVLCGTVFSGIVMVTTCVFQSTGKAGGALALSAGRQGYIYIAVILALSTLFGYKGVVTAQPVSDFLCATLAVILYYALIHRTVAAKTQSPLDKNQSRL